MATRRRRKVPKRLQTSVSRKISKFEHEGYPHKKAVAAGINYTLSKDRKSRSKKKR